MILQPCYMAATTRNGVLVKNKKEEKNKEEVIHCKKIHKERLYLMSGRHLQQFRFIGYNIRFFITHYYHSKSKSDFGLNRLVFYEDNIMFSTSQLPILINIIPLNEVILHLHNTVIPKINHRTKMQNVFGEIRVLPGIGIDYQNAALRFKEIVTSLSKMTLSIPSAFVILRGKKDEHFKVLFICCRTTQDQIDRINACLGEPLFFLIPEKDLRHRINDEIIEFDIDKYYHDLLDRGTVVKDNFRDYEIKSCEL